MGGGVGYILLGIDMGLGITLLWGVSRAKNPAFKIILRIVAKVHGKIF